MPSNLCTCFKTIAATCTARTAKYSSISHGQTSIRPAFTQSLPQLRPTFIPTIRRYSATSSVPTENTHEIEEHHADSNAHPSTPTQLAQDAKYLLQLYPRPDVIFTHGQGCYLYDQAGRKFLDLNAGIAVNALGHADKNITKVIADQAGKLIHLSNLYHHEYAGQFAKAIVESLPKLEPGKVGKGSKLFFCNSGTEANEGG